MLSRVVLTREPLSTALAALDESWRTPPGTGDGAVGAWLDFYGIVREWDVPGEHVASSGEVDSLLGLRISALEYEAHEEMAVHQMERILAGLAERHSLKAVLVIHRIGVIPVGEASLLVRVLSPHREEALRACAEFIDELKRWVPVWKHPVPRAGASGP